MYHPTNPSFSHLLSFLTSSQWTYVPVSQAVWCIVFFPVWLITPSFCQINSRFVDFARICSKWFAVLIIFQYTPKHLVHITIYTDDITLNHSVTPSALNIISIIANLFILSSTHLNLGSFHSISDHSLFIKYNHSQIRIIREAWLWSFTKVCSLVSTRTSAAVFRLLRVILIYAKRGRGLLSTIWKSDLSDKIKRDFFQAVLILLYGCTPWMLIKRIKKKLNGSYT